jgi:hypothetical protein
MVWEQKEKKTLRIQRTGPSERDEGFLTIQRGITMPYPLGTTDGFSGSFKVRRIDLMPQLDLPDPLDPPVNGRKRGRKIPEKPNFADLRFARDLEIIALRLQGMTIEKTAEEIGVSCRKVVNVMRDWRIKNNARVLAQSDKP